MNRKYVTLCIDCNRLLGVCREDTDHEKGRMIEHIDNRYTYHSKHHEVGEYYEFKDNVKRVFPK